MRFIYKVVTLRKYENSQYLTKILSTLIFLFVWKSDWIQVNPTLVTYDTGESFSVKYPKAELAENRGVEQSGSQSEMEAALLKIVPFIILLNNNSVHICNIGGKAPINSIITCFFVYGLKNHVY